jgi:hypothetical protein
MDDYYGGQGKFPGLLTLKDFNENIGENKRFFLNGSFKSKNPTISLTKEKQIEIIKLLQKSKIDEVVKIFSVEK